MSCKSPRPLYHTDNGNVTLSKPHPSSKHFATTKCHMCNQCQIDYRISWGLRGQLENQMHQHSQFVTLTYDNEHLPQGANLYPKHHQDFFKRVRNYEKRHGNKQTIRYMLCGEYGRETSRPHYHAIIFGLELPDKILKYKTQKGVYEYSSAILTKLWPHGSATASSVTPAACSYIVSYMKKDSINRNENARTQAEINGHKYLGNYIKVEKSIDLAGNITKNLLPYQCLNPSTGVITERMRPYARFSTNPGIGRAWFDKYYKDMFPKGYINLDGKKCFAPGYFYDLLRQIDRPLYEAVKQSRIQYAETFENHTDNTPQRRLIKAIVQEANISKNQILPDSDPNNRTFTADENYDSWTDKQLENKEIYDTYLPRQTGT